MLGGAHFQVPAIKAAKEMGHFIITCDNLEDNPGHKYSDKYYNVSTTDKEAVLELAKSLQIDGIMCYAADSGAPTVAYVAEKLGLPSHPYESTEILVYKDKFREFQRKKGFNVPKSKVYNTFEEAKADFHNFTMPVMIKPVDSSGSKGISKVDSIESLEEKVEIALKFTKAGRFLMEEYIENYGPHVGGDGFCVNGQLVFRCFSNEYFSTNHINPFVPIITTWPLILPEHIQNKIHDEVQKVLTLLNMKTGALNFDIRVDSKENVYLIEIAPRNGGAWNPNAITYATGVDTIKYSIKAALGERCNELAFSNTRGYWATYVINSMVSGVFKGIDIHEAYKENIVEYELVVKRGDHISPLSGAHEQVGLMILTFSSMEEMIDKMNNITNNVKVILENEY
ncbi:ATP-grasp domain-containing protein [Lysinibacillus antri]|uniref:ATP-grasp domain-containing protein n=2 Tax=Lysinibacillus antri TaxID=2498145 RepID=A0A432LFN5_9BACI|nr:ATP-grasp domain-containing protein [Lysinibacillus antri]